MRSITLNALLLAAALSLPAQAATVRMMGAGNVTCKEWTQLRASSEYFSAGNWLLGFLSSSAWNTGKDILSGKNPEALFKAVDQYCTADANSNIAEAAVELAEQMLENFSPE